MPAQMAERIADTAMIFWLSTAVSGGIGYLIGNSANRSQKRPDDNSSGDTVKDGDNVTIQKE